MTKLGLMANETKTSVKNARHQQFDFLGYAFGPQKLRRDGHVYLGQSIPEERAKDHGQDWHDAESW